MNKKERTIKKISKHRGQYYVTLGMVERAHACFPVRKAIARRLKMPYPEDSDFATQHPKRDEPILFTEELLRRVLGKTGAGAAAAPWQVVDYVAGRADEKYGSTITNDLYYDGTVDIFVSHKLAVEAVVNAFREWGYIE